MGLGRITILSLTVATASIITWAAQEQTKQSEPQKGSTADSASPSQEPEETQGLPTAVASPEQQEDFRAAFGEPDSDLRIRLGEQFLLEWPESQLIHLMYSALAQAYRDKNNYGKVVEYGEKCLVLDPDNVTALSIVAHTLPKRLEGSGLEQAQKLSRSARYAKHGLKMIDDLPQPAESTPEVFEEIKNEFRQLCHSALGLVYLHRRMPKESQKSFELAISLTSSPFPQDFFRLGEAYTHFTGPREIDYEKAIGAYEKASQLAPGTVIDQVATDRVEQLKKTRKALGL